MRNIFILLLATPFLVQCNGGGGNGVVKLDDLCSEVRKANCSVFTRCDLDWLFMINNHQRCEDAFRCEDMKTQQMMIDSVNAGRMAYDGNAARRCLDAFNSADCVSLLSTSISEPLKCDGVFTGLVAEGQDCYDDRECADGLYCDESDGNCPGQCTPYTAVGEACFSEEVCDPDIAWCDPENDVCTEKRGDGEDCLLDNDCRDGLRCDNDTVPSVCVPLGLEGDACDARWDCQESLMCVNDICTGQKKKGATCFAGLHYEGMFLVCEAGLYCDADIAKGEPTGSCQSQKGTGEDCVYFAECASGLVCIGAEVNPDTQQVTLGKCDQPIQSAGACNPEAPTTECDYDQYCYSTSGTCVSYPGLGDTCVYSEDPECIGGDLYCDSLQAGVAGTCRERKEVGEACSDYDECKSWRCREGTCQPEDSCAP